MAAFFTGSRYIVAGVTLLIAYITLTSQIFVFVPWLWAISKQTTFAVLVPFNIGVGFIYWNYYLCCTTEPGSPPKGWGAPEQQQQQQVSSAISTSLDHHQHDHTSEPYHRHTATATTTEPTAADPSTSSLSLPPTQQQAQKTPKPRFCKSCQGYKPPRSHHCRICKKCVLKMDHHCPWINNCVGYYNFGHFIRFITWVTLTTGMCMILLIWRVVDAIQNEQVNFYVYGRSPPSPVQVLFMALNIFVDGAVLLAVGLLCGYHLWSLGSNTSTIEVWEIEKVQAMVDKGRIRQTKFPYDIGCLKNYRQSLGHNPLFWFWPQSMTGTGLEFPRSQDKDAALIWPPREYQQTKKQDRAFVSPYASSNYNRSRKSSSSPKSRRSEGASSESTTRATVPPPAPLRSHIRRGSEGWVVQDLTIQQRQEMFDIRLQYEAELEQAGKKAQQDGQEEEEEEEVERGFSDDGGQDAFGRYAYNDGEDQEGGHEGVDEYEGEDYQGQDAMYDDVPYDMPSDEYESQYSYEDDEEEEEEEEVDDQSDDDEVTLHGRERSMIGRFFENQQKLFNAKVTTDSSDDEQGGEVEMDHDIWDEGEGLLTGCTAPPSMAQGEGGLNSPSGLVTGVLPTATAAASAGSKKKNKKSKKKKSSGNKKEKEELLDARVFPGFGSFTSSSSPSSSTNGPLKPSLSPGKNSYDPTQKTLFMQLVEREQAMKQQQQRPQ